MEIEEVDIGSLRLDPANANVHNEESINGLKASLKEFGQQWPIMVCKDNVVRCGNGVYIAAMRLCWRKIKIIRTDLTGPKLVAFAIADNRLAQLSNLDARQVTESVKQIQREFEQFAGKSDSEILELVGTLDLDVKRLVSAIGYSEAELRRLAASCNVFSPGTREREPKGKEKEKEERKSGWVVIVSCSSQDSQQKTYESLKSAGYEVSMATT